MDLGSGLSLRGFRLEIELLVDERMVRERRRELLLERLEGGTKG